MAQLISFEGGDGSGKTTQLKLLAAHLTVKGRSCLITHEPGGTELGKVIRRVLVEGVQGDIAPYTELFLYLADRAQHVREVIQPAREKGQLVLCDRFTDSTLAYQGYGRGVDLNLLRCMNQLASEGIVPDLTLLLDCRPETSLARARRRSASETSGVVSSDRFESESLEFHERVRRGFLELARSEPERFVVLDSLAPKEEIHEQIKEIVDQKLEDV